MGIISNRDFVRNARDFPDRHLHFLKESSAALPCRDFQRDCSPCRPTCSPDPDFVGPGGMALSQSTESPAFAFACGHRGEPASPQPCRTTESPLARTSVRLGDQGRCAQSATGAVRWCCTRALSRVRRDFDTRCARASAHPLATLLRKASRCARRGT